VTSVSIIILNWNGGAEDCLEAVESALAQDHPHTEIIFVDNGSTDGSAEAVREKHPGLVYVDTGENLGCPEGRNRGAEHAKGDLLFFLENDGVWPSTQVVSRAVEFFDTHADVGALYTQVTGFETRTIDRPLDNGASPDRPGLASSFRGGASVVRRNLFESCGGFPGEFFRQAEERYLALRIYDAGAKVVYWPVESMAHKGSDYAGKSQQVSIYALRNTLLTVDRLYPPSVAWLHKLLYLAVNFIRFWRSGTLREYVRAVREYRAMRRTFEHPPRIRLSTLIFVTRVQRGGPRSV